MSRGGLRPGAGRPKKGEVSVSDEAEAAARELGVTPLEYMLGVMNDPEADPGRRDRMAIAAAPFVHAKAGEPAGKKAERDAQARVAQNGTEWEDLLAGPSQSVQ